MVRVKVKTKVKVKRSSHFLHCHFFTVRSFIMCLRNLEERESKHENFPFNFSIANEVDFTLMMTKMRPLAARQNLDAKWVSGDDDDNDTVDNDNTGNQ